jgi:hypothetical protein
MEQRLLGRFRVSLFYALSDGIRVRDGSFQAYPAERQLS